MEGIKKTIPALNSIKNTRRYLREIIRILELKPEESLAIVPLFKLKLQAVGLILESFKIDNDAKLFELETKIEAITKR